MVELEILKKLQGTSIEERILIIEAILQTVKNDMRSTSLKQLSSEERPLRGKVINYDQPYEAVALEDWEKLT
ncbi:MAG: hypothetical protein F6K54_26785 [Okeania sp. SIO3B5]|uniref:hypothetical protein n=1 Tax=Okeania sp. SIO3B5 TaxID=2607811 RepID=UPI00140190C7|nr:hypothetical protein [Okeania sp. SIO3B5]NEO56373.1 hypothetical protein [Okeania sp. SIO3B5]